jgi:nicotinamide-nucleotide amidase
VPPTHFTSQPAPTELVRGILEHLAKRGETLSVAESLTGGALGEAITRVPGASISFVGGAITYTNEIKVKVLGVSEGEIQSHGVVSEEIAKSMADGARKVFQTTWAIATTGVAGPGSSEGVEPGTVWVAISGPVSHVALLEIEGSREIVRNATVTSALAAFERILSTR